MERPHSKGDWKLFDKRLPSPPQLGKEIYGCFDLFHIITIFGLHFHVLLVEIILICLCLYLCLFTTRTLVLNFELYKIVTSCWKVKVKARGQGLSSISICHTWIVPHIVFYKHVVLDKAEQNEASGRQRHSSELYADSVFKETVRQVLQAHPEGVRLQDLGRVFQVTQGILNMM